MISQATVDKLLELYEELNYWDRLIRSKELSEAGMKEAVESKHEILTIIRSYSA